METYQKNYNPYSDGNLIMSNKRDANQKYVYGAGFGWPKWQKTDISRHREKKISTITLPEPDDIPEYIDSISKTRHISEIYYEEHERIRYLEERRAMAKSQRSFRRSNIGFTAFLGGGMAASLLRGGFALPSYMYESNSSQLPATNITNMLGSVNAMLTVGGSFYTKLLDKHFMEVDFRSYLVMPFAKSDFYGQSGVVAPNVSGSNFISQYAFNGDILFGADIKRFGNTQQNMISIIYGLDIWYYNASSFYSNFLTNPCQNCSNGSAGTGENPTTDPNYGTSGIANILGSWMMSLSQMMSIGPAFGVRVGMYHGERAFSTFDSMLSAAPAYFFGYNVGTGSTFNGVTPSFFGANFSFILDYKFNIRLSEKNVWLFVGLRNRLNFGFFLDNYYTGAENITNPPDNNIYNNTAFNGVLTNFTDLVVGLNFGF